MAKKKDEMQHLTLQEQADLIVKNAEKKGVSTNFFFVTTFKRYQVQMKIMTELEKEINELGATVEKEYVKGRQNVYTNPAISEYNKTATAANGRPHELQHTRPPCPSPTPGVHSDSCPSSR